MELRGQSASTQDNYIRRIALFVIHFEKSLRGSGTKKTVPLKGEEFLRRFFLHVRPDGYVRRRSGIVSPERWVLSQKAPNL